MGRYRHRPLHLFGGLGLLLGAARNASLLVYLTVLKLTGEAIGHRPLLTLGVLLVVVGMQLFSLGLVGELSRATTRSGRRGEPRRAARGRDPALAPRLRVLYFGTYERDYPRNAQVISCLRRAGVEVRRAPRRPCGRGGGTSGSPGRRRPLRVAAAEARLLAGGRTASASTPSSSATRATSTCPPRGAPPAAGRSSSTRSCRSRTRSSTIAARFAPGSLPRAAAPRRRPARAPRAPTSSSPTPRRTRASSPRSAGCPPSASPSASSAPRSGSSARLEPPSAFLALFVGKLIPLHGARDDPRGGAARPRDRRSASSAAASSTRCSHDRPANVEWVAWVEYERLPAELHAAGCALGIFGTSAKARRVIPNKAFQALACGTPLVTADTPAARELLRDGESALLVPPATPAALAAAVRRLAADRALARRIGAGGLDAYREPRERGRARAPLARAARARRRAMRAARSPSRSAAAAFAAGFGTLAVLRHGRSRAAASTSAT